MAATLVTVVLTRKGVNIVEKRSRNCNGKRGIDSNGKDEAAG